MNIPQKLKDYIQHAVEDNGHQNMTTIVYINSTNLMSELMTYITQRDIDRFTELREEHQEDSCYYLYNHLAYLYSLDNTDKIIIRDMNSPNYPHKKE